MGAAETDRPGVVPWFPLVQLTRIRNLPVGGRAHSTYDERSCLRHESLRALESIQPKKMADPWPPANPHVLEVGLACLWPHSVPNARFRARRGCVHS